MKRFILLALVLSLIANVWLWQRSADRAARDEVLALERARQPVTTNATSTAVAADPLLTVLKTFDRASPTALRDALRAAGVDESTIRGVIETEMRRRYNVQIAASRTENARVWWKFVRPAVGPTYRDAVVKPLEALLGRDPLDLADAEVRYPFLRPEKRRLLAQIDLDYAEMRSTSTPFRTDAKTKTEREEEKLLAAERRRDVLAALTPAERAEYDLRFSEAATRNSGRYAALNVTEQEYRTIQPLIEAYWQETQKLGRNESSNAQRAERDQRTIDQLVAAVGYDRAVEYLWTSPPLVDTVRAFRDLEIPEANAAKVFQLGAETGTRARDIHYDPSLSAEQKRAALAALRDSVAPKVNALIPPEAQAKVPERALNWFKTMNEGRYEILTPVIVGSNVWSLLPPASVTAPPKDPPFPVSLPHPPP